MRPDWVLNLCCLVLIFAFLGSTSADSDDGSLVPYENPSPSPSRALLSATVRKARLLRATRVICSLFYSHWFPCSFGDAQILRALCSLGLDMDLAKNVMKIVEKYVSNGPHMTKYGVTLGSKSTTIFHIDARSGSLINIYKLDDLPHKLGGTSKGENNVLLEPHIENVLESGSLNQKSDWSIYVVRADYGLRSFALNSGEVMLDGIISDVQAFSCYDETSSSLIENNPKSYPGSSQDTFFEKPLRVVQVRDLKSFEALCWLGIVNGTHNDFRGIYKRNAVPSFYPRDNVNNYGRFLPLGASNPIPEQLISDNGKNALVYQPLHKSSDKGNVLAPKTLSQIWSTQSQADLLTLAPAKTETSDNQIIPFDRGNYLQTTHAYLQTVRLALLHSRFFWETIGLSFLALLAFAIWRLSLLISMRQKSTQQLNDSEGKKSPVSKRKKTRKVGNLRSTANTENLDNSASVEEVENINGFRSPETNGADTWSNPVGPIDGYAKGRKIGKLFLSNKEIAKGSNGTVVLKGIYDGRHVAVKRLVKAHNDIASKEIQNLIASDRHPNIVRWYGVEYDSDFVYLSLELCSCSLSDLVFICSNSSPDSVYSEGKIINSVNVYTIRLNSVKGIDKDVELWKPNGYPSSQLVKLMRDVVSGLAHLHDLGIVHRDLKPQNILISKDRALCAKISDMGISKSLVGEKSSLGNHATGLGSSGWQAPEQLLHRRQTRAVDLFSLGCVLFFCITGGKHPFGDHLERDINIVKNRVDLFIVEHIPEAVDLFSHLLDPDPELRPKASDVLYHPLFWTSELRLSFLRDASDRVELEDREGESELLKALENAAPVALGGNWNEKVEASFIANIGRYRRYKYDSVRDLLRVIRNKLNHYRELPKEIQEILGPVPVGFENYFASRFPKFLIEVYKVASQYCREEDWFWKYDRNISIQ
ncbi:hypothetical protein Syun_005639 [Stephania yunnanensis]|uniref:non-specific serine/threonine protein kinase n=1 Tax=Stephania yunnanensis TaxID=152371 RepID=A0AAP0Q1X8_9MAGN